MLSINQRCFFGTTHGICEFGNVVKIESDGTIIIKGDNGRLYKAEESEIVLL